MKKLIVAGALVALFASPAFAQNSHVRTHINAQARAAHASTAHPSAAQPMIDNGTAGGPNGELIWGGKLRAQDPDPFIRGSILRGMGNYGGN
jgi:hypothetical protein